MQYFMTNIGGKIGLGQLFFSLFPLLLPPFFCLFLKIRKKRCDKDERKEKGIFLCDFIFKLFSFLKRNKNHEIPG